METGTLLKQSRAGYRMHRLAGTKDTPVTYVRPAFLIPGLEKQTTYPRFFAVLSKSKGRESDRSSTLHYFVRNRAAGAWKATAATWAVTDPVDKSASPGPTSSRSAGGGGSTVSVRPKVLPSIRTGSSGAASTSPAAARARTYCGGFADYLSFTAPHGKTDDARFAEGGFTSGVVKYYNGWAGEQLSRSFDYSVTGTELPVFALGSGSSLVACTFDVGFHTLGTSATSWVRYDPGSSADVLLGGGHARRHKVDEKLSMTALIEVPAKASAAATVLACDCYAPQPLSATGVPAN